MFINIIILIFRDPIVDEGPIDLTSSPDLLNDHCDDVFNEVSTPLCPDGIKNSNKNIEVIIWFLFSAGYI